MIVFRCANGVVVFSYGPVRRDNTWRLVCLNDGSRYAVKWGIGIAIPAQLVAIAQHAVSLSGAIQQIIVIPIQFQ